ncbi:alpha/beta hydrolase [Halorientalis halophila]|uniref:alpha/beta hydrolase n=1 Tax=Halorientalis halophila TaxID=3108499 RepID=UPI00300A03B9
MALEPHDVAARDGTRLRLWEQSATDPDRAVLFVHGATYASSANFAPRGAPEYSWLRAVAADGDAAFALDVRGYGDSERPAALDGDPTAAEPPVRADVAAADLRDALAAVRDRVDCPVHLVGTSWGTMISGRLLTDHDPEVASATLHAPVYRPGRELVEGFDLGDPPRASRTLSRAEAKRRWDSQLPGDAASYRGGSGDEDPVFDAFWRTLFESGQGRGDDEIVAPNGTLLDLRDAVDGDPGYDPAAIEAPTLVIRGSRDSTSTRADATALYDDLAVPDSASQYVEIAGGTHYVHLEDRRHALYDAVAGFQDRY